MENIDNNEIKTENTSIRKSSGKAVRDHLWAFLLVAFGVLLYLGLNHLGSIGNAIKTLVKILSPLFTGSLLALFLNCPMVAIQKLILWAGRKISEKKKKEYSPKIRAVEIVSLVLTIILAFLLIYVIVYSVVPQLIESTKSIFAQIQANLPRYYELLDRIDDYGIDTDGIREWLASLDFSALITKITDNAESIISTVISSASSIISGTFTAITSIIFALYVLSNKKNLSCQSKKLGYAFLKEKTVDKMIEIGAITADTFSNFISGQCLDAFILGLMMFVSMTIFGFPYALAISSMITVTAIIPYVGAFLGTAFGVLLMVMNNPVQALLFIVLFIVIQQIDNHIVYPRVVGGSVGLPPIWTFIAVILGGALFGVIGMVIFIPIFSVIYSLISKSVHIRLEERGIVVEEPDYNQKNREADGEKESVGEKITRFLKTASSKISDFIKKTIQFFKNKSKNGKKK